MKRYVILSLAVLLSCAAMAQKKGKILTAEQQYKLNTKKAKINGVYIPKNLDDALNKLEKLSSKKGLEKFVAAPEEVIAKKLHFGLGRWISYNWNFHGGSRYVEHLKSLGLKDIDHMVQFTIVSLHRKLNGKDQNIKDRVAVYEQEVQKKLDERRKRMVKVQ